ncbi:HEAT repeat domain-containing protein [Sphingomonas sp.]|uniref:HEAT repeat domain-containing protein n=1 Tax=Sphingomonas sp. TaxID=28214 RepID=UPI002E0F4521|nr:HEAT repeat domain-containing protein [Sphingomonas sp.]
MSALLLIWTVSLVLAVAAVVVMGGLVLLRLVAHWRRDRHLAARRRLTPLLLAGERIDPAQFRHVPDHVIADLSLSLMQLVRGPERTAFIASATQFGVPERLARRMRAGAVRDRMAALQGVAQFDNASSRAALRRALGDPDRNIRLAAAQALADKGEAFELIDLVRQLELGAGQSSRLTVSLFASIARTRPNEIKELVLQLDQKSEVRVAAVEALAETGDFSLVPMIAELALAARDATDELPRYIHALGQFGHPSGARAVRLALSSKSMAARAAAAQAAGRIGMVDAVDGLIVLLDDPEWWVRFRAAEALIVIGPPGIARLREAAKRGDGVAAEVANAILAERGIAR